jgi:cell division protein FtsB
MQATNIKSSFVLLLAIIASLTLHKCQNKPAPKQTSSIQDTIAPNEAKIQQLVYENNPIEKQVKSAKPKISDLTVKLYTIKASGDTFAIITAQDTLISLQAKQITNLETLNQNKDTIILLQAENLELFETENSQLKQENSQLKKKLKRSKFFAVAGAIAIGFMAVLASIKN